MESQFQSETELQKPLSKCKKGIPIRIGISFTEGTLASLPVKDSEYTIPLPAGVSVAPYDHVGLNWNPMGHEPTEIYGVPHFDFHFYFISESLRHHITCAGTDRAICLQAPEVEYIPAQYAPTPEGVPMMGWHWIDTLSPEWHGMPFVNTLIQGFYQGNLSFIEPMITQNFLLSKTESSFPIRKAQEFQQRGYYPDAYSIHYDSVGETYSVTLENLEYRTP